MRSNRKNPNARNFGLGSKKMELAGKNALHEDMKSYSSIKTMHQKWLKFCRFSKAVFDIKDMRKIEKAHVEIYAHHLIEQYENGEIAASTAQNDLSAINRVMQIARGDKAVHVAPVKDAAFPRRNGIAKEDKSISESMHNKAIQSTSERLSILLDLQRHFGLRFEESAKFDAKKAFSDALKYQKITFVNGTKGGRKRSVPITSNKQILLLEKAAQLQQSRSLIPKEQSYKIFRQQAYKEMLKLPIHFHGERHHYAQQRYLALMNQHCPVKAKVSHGKAHHHYLAKQLNISVREARAKDKQVRLLVAKELGHNRIEITNAYLG